MRRTLVGIALITGGWLFWPLLRPLILPPPGRPWLVVLDGYHRLDRALMLQRQPATASWPILLITCPRTEQPTPAQRAQAAGPLAVLLEGIDTAAQAAALARWLEQQPFTSRPARIWLLSDQHHFPRALWAAQLAVGGLGVVVEPMPVDADAPRLLVDPWSFRQLGPAWRDALRLQFWRLTGSTGAWLDPAAMRSKQEACW